ncbi:MAG TPA: hypothetical protein DG761_11360 [Gammaproteobacteria bacterium]|nr:hypothetical protein [Gammaproteobacteria bacterium]|tara:strand:- start:718 stop:1413 length:696 start_codon:yes stop_codon:yes gene_type:complete
MLRPTTCTYEGKRVWIETDDINISEHLAYRVKINAVRLQNNENLADVNAVDNGETAPEIEKKVVKITTRYTCASCKSGFEAPGLAGKAKACPNCGMATVIDHAARPMEPVPAHWSDGLDVSPEDKALMKSYLTSKEYMERPAAMAAIPATVPIAAPLPVAEPVAPPAGVVPEEITAADTPPATPAATKRYSCGECKEHFDRAVIVKKKKTCRKCGSRNIIDNVVTDVTDKE